MHIVPRAKLKRRNCAGENDFSWQRLVGHDVRCRQSLDNSRSVPKDVAYYGDNYTKSPSH